MVQARGVGCPFFAGRHDMIKRIGFVFNANDLVLDNFTTAGVLAVSDGYIDVSSTEDYGIRLTGTLAAGIEIPAAASVTIGLSIVDTCTDGIKISGACTDAIDLSGSSTLGIRSAGPVTFVTASKTLTSQSTEGKYVNLTYSTDSTFVSGTNVTYSGAYTSSVLKIVGTHTGTTGGLHGILVQMIQDQNFTAAAEGIIGIKSYLDMTDSAITEGNFMASAFISKKSGSGTMATGAILHGIEAWTYVTDTSVVGTMIGGNIGYHGDSSGDCSAAGTVWKALQVFCDNGSMTNPAAETTGVDIWLIAGTVDNALKIGPSAATTFTTGIRFVSGGTVTTGIKFGGTGIAGAGNVTMTTAIDIDEVASLATGILIEAVCTTAALNITGTTSGRAILVCSSSSPYVCTSARNYPVGVFAKIAATEDTTVELRAMWGRFRVDADVQIGSAAGWGAGVQGIEGNVKVYGGTTTDIYSWKTCGVWGMLECDNASSINFKAASGTAVSYACGVFAHIELGQNTEIETGSFGAAIVAFSNSHASATTTGSYDGIVVAKESGKLSFDNALRVRDSVAATGIDIGTCGTAGITFSGTHVVAINTSGAAVATILAATATMAGGTATNAVALTCNNAQTHSANYARGLFIDWTQTGTITGTGEINGIGLDVHLNGAGADTPYLYGMSIYTRQTSNPTAAMLAGISMYIDNMGSAAGHMIGLDMGFNQSGGDPTGGGRFAYIRCRSHNATYMPHYFTLFEGLNAAERLFFWDTGALGNMLSVHSAGTTPEYNIKVYIEGIGERFIKIYDAA